MLCIPISPSAPKWSVLITSFQNGGEVRINHKRQVSFGDKDRCVWPQSPHPTAPLINAKRDQINGLPGSRKPTRPCRMSHNSHSLDRRCKGFHTRPARRPSWVHVSPWPATGSRTRDSRPAFDRTPLLRSRLWICRWTRSKWSESWLSSGTIRRPRDSFSFRTCFCV